MKCRAASQEGDQAVSSFKGPMDAAEENIRQ